MVDNFGIVSFHNADFRVEEQNGIGYLLIYYIYCTFSEDIHSIDNKNVCFIKKKKKRLLNLLMRSIRGYFELREAYRPCTKCEVDTLFPAQYIEPETNNI